MKKHTLSVVLLCLSFLSFAEELERTAVKSTLKTATVFLSKAQLTHTATANVPVGTTILEFGGHTAYLDPQSLQVSGQGNFTIISVSHEKIYTNQAEPPARIKAVKDSLEAIQEKIDFNNRMVEVLNKEEQLLMANQQMKGQNSNLTASDLEDMADFFRDRMEDIILERAGYHKKTAKLKKRQSEFMLQLNEYNQTLNKPHTNILVTVSAKAATSAQFEISYITSNAGWTPQYDIRAKDTKSPVTLAYKAMVVQQTGMDWNNVRLTLSTSNPSANGVKPELSPWFVNFYQPVVLYKSKENAKVAAPVTRSMDAASGVYADEVQANYSLTTADFTTEVETTLAIEFDIALPYNVPNGGKGQLVDIKNIDLPASYDYSTVPKLETTAFLMARIVEWEKYNLLNGTANIYFEGTFVGTSYIDPNNTNDTLAISLGKDSRIVVERNVVKDFTTKRTIGTNKKDEYAYDIVIRNTKKEAITIIVEDQYPISQQNQIEVELLESTGATVNATTGKLTWKLTINPGDTKTLRLKYSIKYPKDKQVR
ncbi:MAG: DUF4139 domain-containing protein [Cytophagaceae bacterium]